MCWHGIQNQEGMVCQTPHKRLIKCSWCWSVRKVATTLDKTNAGALYRQKGKRQRCTTAVCFFLHAAEVPIQEPYDVCESLASTHSRHSFYVWFHHAVFCFILVPNNNRPPPHLACHCCTSPLAAGTGHVIHPKNGLAQTSDEAIAIGASYAWDGTPTEATTAKNAQN